MRRAGGGIGAEAVERGEGIPVRIRVDCFCNFHSFSCSAFLIRIQFPEWAVQNVVQPYDEIICCVPLLMGLVVLLVAGKRGGEKT